MLKTGVVAVFVLIGAAYYYYTTTFASNLAFESYFTDNNVDSGMQLQYILNNFKQWLQHFLGSAFERSEGYINMLNRFGWLNYGYAVLCLQKCVYRKNQWYVLKFRSF